MEARIAAVDECHRGQLVEAAIRWLTAVDDEVAAGQPEAELEASAVDFIDGSDWRS